MITLEDTKRIAEALRYSGFGTDEFGSLTFNNKRFTLTSPKIQLEMLKWLLDNKWTFRKVNKRYVLNKTLLSGATGIRSKSLEQCLIDAMLKQIGIE